VSISSIQIDGSDVSLVSVWVHHQTDPYPGGHRYRLTVPLAIADAWLRKMRISWTDVQGSSLFWFQSLVCDLAGSARYSSGISYVLNTIDQIEKTETAYLICGVCSPFVRPSNSGG
jgi:hypothetical protein